MNKMLMGIIIALGFANVGKGAELRNNTDEAIWVMQGQNYSILPHLETLPLTGIAFRIKKYSKSELGADSFNFNYPYYNTMSGDTYLKIKPLIDLPVTFEIITDQNSPSGLNIIFPNDKEIKEAQAKKTATPAQKESKAEAELATIKAQIKAKDDEIARLKNVISNVKEMVAAVKL